MSYNIFYQPRALEEYEEAVKWYSKRSRMAAENFEAAVEERIEVLKTDPERFRKTYNEFREVTLKKYPYLLIYFVDNMKKQVIISSIFHNKRDSEAKFEEE